jgi:hypothetical protein
VRRSPGDLPTFTIWRWPGHFSNSHFEKGAKCDRKENSNHFRLTQRDLHYSFPRQNKTEEGKLNFSVGDG